MAFSRNSLAAAVAGTLSLAVLTGCPATPPTGAGTPTAAPGTPTAAPGTPTAAPGESAAPVSPAPGASVAPSAAPSPSGLTPTTLRGKVYDLDGAVINTGAKVTVKSLNASQPFESTVDVLQGSYVVNNVPAGVQLEVTASRTGWTSRTRVETLLPLTSTQANIVNFGGAAGATSTTAEDPEGLAYFIAEYPEVTSVVPADEAENVDPTKLSVVLTLSEPLDTTNQRRFANAIRVFPNNDAAAPGSSGSDLDRENTNGYNVDDNAAYFVKEGSIFLDDDATRASVTWDAAGQVATLTFNAPLISADNENAEYAIALVAQSDDIEDADGNELGQVSGMGSFTGQSEAGDILENVFRETDLSLGNTDETETTDLWALTHQSVTTFEVAEDETDPQLTGVSVTEVGGETRISLTFSEPMAAYNDSPTGYFDPSLTLATAYTFAVAEETADLTNVDLEGDVNQSTEVVAPTATNVGAQTGGDYAQEREFQIGTGSYATTDTGAIYMEVSPSDPKTVRLVLNSTAFFSDDVNAIKARVEGVADPAGNLITDTQADAQIKTGNI